MRSRRAGSEPTPPAPAGLFAAALRLLGRREYTTSELTTRLLDRGYEPGDVIAVVDRLTADGSLDDRRAAAAHVRSATRLKGRGRLRVERELVARGVHREIVHELLAGLPAEDEETSIAKVLARKRLPARLTAAEHRRIFQHLLRRGFPADAIAKALRSRGDFDPYS